MSSVSVAGRPSADVKKKGRELIIVIMTRECKMCLCSVVQNFRVRNITRNVDTCVISLCHATKTMFPFPLPSKTKGNGSSRETMIKESDNLIPCEVIKINDVVFYLITIL